MATGDVIPDATVLAIADDVKGFAATWGRDRAEAHVATKLAEVRQRFTQDGLDLTPIEAIAQVERAAREQWDAEAAEAGKTLDMLLTATQTHLAARVAAAERLTPTVHP